MLKKITTVLAIAALTAAGATVVFAGGKPGTGVNGSMHDITYMAATGGYYNQDQFQRVCIFCHTPHNAKTIGQLGGLEAPLWNHELSTLPDPTPYQWAAPANLPITIADPLAGPTRLCLGCHDGVTAVDSHGGAGQANNGNHLMSGPRVINDFMVTHPVGFLYDDAIQARNTDPTKPEIVTPDNFFVNRVLVGTSASSNDTNQAQRAASGWTYTTKKIGDALYQGVMTCATCHEVHNYRNSENDPAVDIAGNPTGTTPNYFVWAREQGSALCLSCHYK